MIIRFSFFTRNGTSSYICIIVVLPKKRFMGYLKEYIESIVDLSDVDWQCISSFFVRREYKKGECLITSGQTEKFLSFIEEGTVRYYFPADDKERTFDFSFDKQFTCAYDSFLTQQPCNYIQEALSKTVVWSVSYDDLQTIYDRTKSGKLWGHHLLEDWFLQKSKREIRLLKQSAKERYLDIIYDQPYMIQKVPLKYIASYIGITPQALSRIRKSVY